MLVPAASGNEDTILDLYRFTFDLILHFYSMCECTVIQALTPSLAILVRFLVVCLFPNKRQHGTLWALLPSTPWLEKKRRKYGMHITSQFEEIN